MENGRSKLAGVGRDMEELLDDLRRQRELSATLADLDLEEAADGAVERGSRHDPRDQNIRIDAKGHEPSISSRSSSRVQPRSKAPVS
jgi:hypothetical protein